MSGEQLLTAIRDGDEERAKALLSEQPELADALDPEGVPLLIQALYHRQTSIVEAIASIRRNYTVHEAAALGAVDQLGELLDEDPGGVRAWSPDGFTPLHLAAFFGRAEAVALLLERGAAVDDAARNPMKVMPLHSAAAIGDVEICRALLAAEADPNAKQQAGYTPLMSAALRGNDELVELLLEHGAEVGATSDEDRTAADLAAQGGHEELAKRLS